MPYTNLDQPRFIEGSDTDTNHLPLKSARMLSHHYILLTWEEGEPTKTLRLDGVGLGPLGTETYLSALTVQLQKYVKCVIDCMILKRGPTCVHQTFHVY